MFAVYKYVCKGEVVYVGRTDSDVVARIKCHKGEYKFKNYLDSQIFVAELGNKAETIGMEALLINKYKPILNESLKYDTYTEIQFREPEWFPLDGGDVFRAKVFKGAPVARKRMVAREKPKKSKVIIVEPKVTPENLREITHSFTAVSADFGKLLTEFISRRLGTLDHDEYRLLSDMSKKLYGISNKANELYIKELEADSTLRYELWHKGEYVTTDFIAGGESFTGWLTDANYTRRGARRNEHPTEAH